MKKIILAVFLLIFISGCIELNPSQASEGIAMKLSASPPQVFAGKETVLYLDIENKNEKAIHNAEVDVFDKGRLSGECSKSIGSIEKNALEIFQCRLRAPRADLLPESRVDNIVWARLKYNNSLAATQVVKIISQSEYEIRQSTGKAVREPKSYSYSDRNIGLVVEFSSDLPLVAGRKGYVYFTIKNIGNGFVTLKNIDIQGSGILSRDCLSRIPDMIGKSTPRAACELFIGNINYLSSPTIIITIDYNYELRDKITIPVIK